MTAQLLSVEVPFSSTALKLGSSVGGPGASLQTAGDVLLDCVGVMDIQSAAAFVGQTSAAMSMLSAAIQKIHSQAKVELFAGGGISPSACGPSGPVSAPDHGPPGAASEKVTGLATAALSATSASYGLKDAFSPNLAIEAAGKGAKVIAVAVGGIAAVGGVSAIGNAASGSGSGGAAAPAGAGAGAGAGGASSSGEGGSHGASSGSGGGGGGGTHIEERASANIKMVAGKKISGIAPAMISSKTLGKFEVKALLVTDFTTVLFTNFALAKFEVKALDAFKTVSGKFEVEADVAVDIKTKDFKGKAPAVTMDGHTKVTKVTDVKGKTTLKDDLEVERNALMKDKLTVKKKVEVKGTLTVKKNTKVTSTATIDGDVKTKTVTFKSRVTFGL